MKDFWKGVIAGVVGSAIIFGVIIAFHFLNKRDKELIEYAEKQIEIEALREDYVNRDPVEFLDNVPGVRGAADGAAAEFDRKRDEILERFRNRLLKRVEITD
jgi:hypothetical protein